MRDDILRLYSVVPVLVGTPGRILDLADKARSDVKGGVHGFLSIRFCFFFQGVALLSKCTMIVMDEADKLLSEDFVPVVERLLALSAPNRQISLFSATFPVTVKDFKVSQSVNHERTRASLTALLLFLRRSIFVVLTL